MCWQAWWIGSFFAGVVTPRKVFGESRWQRKSWQGQHIVAFGVSLRWGAFLAGCCFSLQNTVFLAAECLQEVVALELAKLTKRCLAQGPFGGPVGLCGEPWAVGPLWCGLGRRGPRGVRSHWRSVGVDSLVDVSGRSARHVSVVSST